MPQGDFNAKSLTIILPRPLIPLYLRHYLTPGLHIYWPDSMLSNFCHMLTLKFNLEMLILCMYVRWIWRWLGLIRLKIFCHLDHGYWFKTSQINTRTWLVLRLVACLVAFIYSRFASLYLQIKFWVSFK
jgi:hypothetical protein